MYQILSIEQSFRNIDGPSKVECSSKTPNIGHGIVRFETKFVTKDNPALMAIEIVIGSKAFTQLFIFCWVYFHACALFQRSGGNL
jgi:hypothetical protein